MLKIRKIERKEDVYDFTVSGNNNFYCSDILVHNCSEKPLAAYSSCMLGSINMGKFPVDIEKYKPILKEKIGNLIRLIDNAIQYEIDEKRYGVEQQREIMELTREVGLGYTNLHQWFINAGVQYDSDEAIEMIAEFVKWYAFYAFEASQELAREKGPAGAYNDYDFTNDDLMNSIFFKNIVNEFYDGDAFKVQPLRNLALMSIAPAGTLSLVFPEPCISSGTEPGMGAHWRKTRAISKSEYDYYFIFPAMIKRELRNKIQESSAAENVADHDFMINVGESTLDNTGALGVEVLALIDKYLGKGTFRPAHEIDPMQKIKMMGKIYQWIDAAVSVTYNVPETTTPEEIENIYMQAWKNGVRAVSVYREGSREGILVFEPPSEEKNKISYCDERPKNIIFNCSPKRDNEMPCDIHHCKVQGQDWLVLVGMHNDYPYEIFAGEHNKEEMYVPQSVKNGILKKTGAKYSLIVPIRRSEVEYKNIADTFLQENHRSLTRMVSLSLRHGVRPIFIVDQLKKSKEGITEFSAAVSRVLSKYIKDLDYTTYTKQSKECNVCGGTSFSYEGGCRKCQECGTGACD